MASKRSKAGYLFFIIGLLVLLISGFMTAKAKRDEFFSTTIQGVALIILTVVVIDFLWSIVGGDPVSESLLTLRATLGDLRTSVRLLEDSNKTGLRRIFATSGAAGSQQDWMNRLKSARSSVDLMGYSLHVWTRGRDFENTLARMAREGVRIRVLIMAPDNPEITAFVNHRQIGGITLDMVREEIKAALQAFKKIAANLDCSPGEANFELRMLKGGVVVAQICRTDSKLTAIQYLYSAVASRTPLLEVEGEESDLFEVYLEEFEQVWKLATPA